MRILGIDPGSVITGYGIVERQGQSIVHIDNGTLDSSPKLPLAARLVRIHDGLTAIFQEFKPAHVAIENVFFAKNARSSLLLGHARGVSILAASKAGIPLEEYMPSQVKLAITGNGRADKEQIQRMVKMMLRLPEIACEDASDALAVALCHCHSLEMKRRIAQR